ncbi:YciI family protein [Bremerella cremea]|uniref:Dehydrogenase n=1 Tax=Blastopirellula marina TaxID=124 RepID=A0A2S8FPV8_9BACT|nr:MULTISPECIES: YciI family protein [Pirellulaceae]PQO34197.1 dehydrogenase [Blastopirellula marina]RCS46693.1 YciI family protein [Bremerella cremea]
MKVMVIVKATQESEAGKLPSTELLEAMGQFNQQLVDAGIMLAGEGLKPSSQGARVRFQGDDRVVTDGPFAETKELIAGYWMWKVASLQEAIDWVKKCPPPMEGESEIEIRPVYEMEDFAEADPTGEIRAHEQEMRDKLEG